eukprot:jgi/Picsp_1/2167/NSC_05632-R1_78 kda intermediate flagellar outer arm
MMEESEEDKANVKEGWEQGSADGVTTDRENGREENVATEVKKIDIKELEYGSGDDSESTNGASAEPVDGSKNIGNWGCPDSEDQLPVKENEIEGVTFDYLRGSFVPLDAQLKQKWAYLDAECGPKKTVLRHEKKDGVSGSRGRPRLKVEAQIWTNDAHRGCENVYIQARGSELRNKATQTTRDGVESFLKDKDVKVEESAIPYRESILESGRGKYPNKFKFEIDSARISKRELVKAETLMGRVLFQNADVEAFQDFLHYEDDLDDIRPNEGTLLPLWNEFSHICTDSIHPNINLSNQSESLWVTVLQWHPVYEDLLVVGLGTFDSEEKTNGLVNLYSLMNLNQPEASFEFSCGVTAVSIEPQINLSNDSEGHWMVVGCQDGGLHVVSLLSGIGRPERAMFSSRAEHNHLGPIWTIFWNLNAIMDGSATEKGACMNPSQKYLCTISNDGLVGVWSLDTQVGLTRVKTQQLGKLGHHPQKHGLGVYENLQTCGLELPLCSAAHPSLADAITGTLDGKVVLTGSKHGQAELFCFGEHKQTVECNSNPIYAVAWSPFQSDYFLAASYDSIVSIWDSNKAEYRLSLDLGGNSIADCQWSPSSSTILGAITEEGYMLMYDLSISKTRPTCKQKISSSGTLTKLVYHRWRPLAIVGTSMGGVLTFKPSKNLRMRKEQQDSEAAFFQDEDETDGQKDRPMLPIQDQRKILNEVLQTPY